jgi:SNF2 family DNA or RNA helicase
VVCPASLVYNWQEEFTRFAPEIRTATVTGTLSERKKILEQAASVDVLITSYDLLKRDAVYYKSHKFRWQIADEAQFIKNPKSSAAKAVKIINSSRRIALTGTPIENRLSEMWSIFDFLMPGFLFKYDEFRTKFETPIAKSHDADATERLQKMVAPFILRRLKKDVLKDLPDKIEEVRYAKLEGEQRKLYDAQVLHMQKMLEMPAEELLKSRIQVLAELTKIRQICCDPSLLSIDYNGESAKREACLQLIMSAMDGGHRMLVFSQFTSMLSLLMEDLDAAGIRYYLITGATSKEERIHLVHEFNDGECQTDLEFSEDGSAGNVKSKGSARSDDNSKGVSVFLISLKAGGTGLNLTGADVVIHYDPWWNVAAQNQATDRAHRIGQTKTVAVYRLIAKDTIEEKIMDIQENKKDLADAILSGEQQSLGQLSRDELMDLLKV